MNWSVKLYLLFLVISVIYFLFFASPTPSCLDSCGKNDIQCQRDCEIEDDRWEVSI